MVLVYGSGHVTMSGMSTQCVSTSSSTRSSWRNHPNGVTSNWWRSNGLKAGRNCYQNCFKNGIIDMSVRHACYFTATVLTRCMKSGYSNHLGIRDYPGPYHRSRTRYGGKSAGLLCIRHLCTWSARGQKSRRTRSNAPGSRKRNFRRSTKWSVGRCNHIRRVNYYCRPATAAYFSRW